MPLRILLAEDDPAVSRLVRYCLEGQGYTVFVAADGLAALNLAYSEQPDLILLDLLLPSLNGQLVCQALRQDERTRAVPILFLTGAADEIKPGAWQAEGVLRKPFTPARLLEVVAPFDPVCTDKRGGERV